jgi:2-acylglycerol O-acyltransferase 1
MSSRPSVLFLTNPENGQSNVVLAVAYELLKSNNLNIHVASWPLLEPRLAKISAQVASENPSLKIQPITFHCMPFKSIHTSYETNFNTTLANIPHKPGWKDLDKLRDDCPKVFTPEPEDHMESVRFCVELGEKIDPALILLDPICNPAHDMARYGAGGRWKDKHAVLSPCSIHGGIVRGQNFLQCLFRFPG